MKLIKPSQISGEILTLFEEADEKMIIVSPYCRILKWYKLLNKLKSLQEREIDIEFYVREGETATIEEIEQVGIEPICIKNLHCKMYMNEKEAIVSSMNLLLSSETNSLEIAYKTTTKEEYSELVDFYNRYIKQKEKEKNQTTHDKTYLFDSIIESFENIKIYENDNEFVFKTRRNTYSCFIWNDRKKNKNLLRISGILSNKQFEYSKTIITDIEEKTKLKIECIEGRNGHYDTIWGTSLDYLESLNMNYLLPKEVDLLTENIMNFITVVEKIKNSR